MPTVETCREPGCSEPVWLTKRGPYRRCRLHHIQRQREGYYSRRGVPIGARVVDRQGYAWITIGTRRVAEHRAVMEEILGRPLRKGESVHHKNGVRNDNRRDNLELWIGGIRYGQRATEIECPHCQKPYLILAA